MTFLQGIHQKLLDHYGSQRGESAKAPLESLVIVILSTRASAKNVAQAIANLREEGALGVRALQRMSSDELQALIEPAGQAPQKAKRLRDVLQLAIDEYEGSLESMLAAPIGRLRKQLLAINGIAPETADAILLDVGGRPVFIVDLHAQRVLARHGWIDFDADYHTVQELLTGSLEPNPAIFRELHSLLERVGSEHCRKTPQCEHCPLEALLPPGGPREPQ